MRNIMGTRVQACSGTVTQSPEPMAIHTTLYNLLAALSAEAGPDEEDVLTATVVHLLNTYRVTCTGNLKGYRLVCDGGELLARSGPREDGLFSHFDGDASHFERDGYTQRDEPDVDGAGALWHSIG